MKQVKNSNKNIRIYLILMFLIIVGIITYTFGKYVLNNKDIAQINASSFYFTSTAIDIDEKVHNYYDWNGSSQYNIIFDIKNYEDELRYSSYDIPYEVKIETEANGINVNCYINDEETIEGDLIGNQKSTDKIRIAISVDENNTLDKIVLKITISTKSPYSKIISGIYNIYAEKKNEYETKIKSELDYEKLLIKTNSFKGDIKIEFDSDKLMFYSDFLEDVNIEDNVIILKTKENSNYQLEFIKKSSDIIINLGEDIKVYN